jgi:hypothetical protein
MSQLHFGPELGRGPFTSYRIDTAALQVAAAIAQIRAPLTRSDADLESHANFIRNLADRLAPDYANAINIDVGAESSNSIISTFTTGAGAYSLLHCWLADDVGGGESGTTPATVSWTTGVVLQTITSNRRYLILTPATGIAIVNVTFGSVKTWRWAISRGGRVFYSSALVFT